jgi:hypothetical protein
MRSLSSVHRRVASAARGQASRPSVRSFNEKGSPWGTSLRSQSTVRALRSSQRRSPLFRAPERTHSPVLQGSWQLSWSEIRTKPLCAASLTARDRGAYPAARGNLTLDIPVCPEGLRHPESFLHQHSPWPLYGQRGRLKNSWFSRSFSVVRSVP